MTQEQDICRATPTDSVTLVILILLRLLGSHAEPWMASTSESFTVGNRCGRGSGNALCLARPPVLAGGSARSFSPPVCRGQLGRGTRARLDGSVFMGAHFFAR